MGELHAEMNRLAGTTGLDAQGAAQIAANAPGADLIGALNRKNGSTGLDLLAVLNALAGTSHLDMNKAAASIPAGAQGAGPTYSATYGGTY